jgi:hypothetical protein
LTNCVSYRETTYASPFSCPRTLLCLQERQESLLSKALRLLLARPLEDGRMLAGRVAGRMLVGVVHWVPLVALVVGEVVIGAGAQTRPPRVAYEAALVVEARPPILAGGIATMMCIGSHATRIVETGEFHHPVVP